MRSTKLAVITLLIGVGVVPVHSNMTDKSKQEPVKQQRGSAVNPLAKYKDANPTAKELFADPMVANPLKQVLGKDYGRLTKAMSEIERTRLDDYGTLIVNGKTGGAKRSSGIFSLGSNGTFAAIQEDKKVSYFTNNDDYAKKLPDEISNWRENFMNFPVEYNVRHNGPAGKPKQY